MSKDSDFSDLAFVHGPPPKVVWLRTGNATTTTVRDLLIRAAAVVASFVDSDEDAVLVLPEDHIDVT